MGFYHSVAKGKTYMRHFLKTSRPDTQLLFFFVHVIHLSDYWMKN